MKIKNDFFSEYIKINGIEQYLLHQTTSDEHPVLLFLHGGPGMSESTFAYYFKENYPDCLALFIGTREVQEKH